MAMTKRPWWTRFSLRVVRCDSLPKASLSGFLWSLAEQGFCPKHIVDIGANRAGWSQKAYRVFPESAYTLIEPQVEMKPHLDRFESRCSSATTLIAGVSDTNGSMTLSLAPDTVSSGFLHTEEAARKRNWPRREVPVFTLDHLVENELNCIPDMVKIDAEGMEARIMQGAKTLIGKTELFLLEAPLIQPPPGWNSFDEIVSMMADFGYVVYEFTHLMRHRGHSSTTLLEIAFARRDGFLRSQKHIPRQQKAAA